MRELSSITFNDYIVQQTLPAYSQATSPPSFPIHTTPTMPPQPTPTPISGRARIAILGSGVSGIAALWALNEYSDHEVNVYEAGDWVGGHTHTVEFERECRAEGIRGGRMGWRGRGADMFDRFYFAWVFPC
jgi:hypothetical protein